MSEPADPTQLWSLLRADLEAVAALKGVRFPSLRGFVDLLSIPGVCAVVLLRVGGYFHHKGLRPLSRMTYFLNTVLFGADIAPGCRIGPGLIIAHPVGCGWGKELVVGRNCVMTGGTRMGTGATPDKKGHPTIGDDVFLLDQCKILGAVTIGDGAVIAANALVLDDVPPRAIMVGQPARLLRYRDEDEAVEASGVGVNA